MNSPSKQTRLKALQRLMKLTPEDRKEVVKRAKEIQAEKARAQKAN